MEYIYEKNNEVDTEALSEAFMKYPLVRSEFGNKFAEYSEAVSRLAAQNPLSIKMQEMKSVDDLAGDVKRLDEEHKLLHSALSESLMEMIKENEELSGDLDHHAGFLKSKEIEFSRVLHKETLELIDKGELILSIEKAVSTKEVITELLTEAKKAWIDKHQNITHEIQDNSIKEV